MLVKDGHIAGFKAYDFRGRVPDELDTELAHKIGQAYARVVAPTKKVCVGHDIRLSSPEIARAVIAGLNASGVDVVFLGQCGTEEVYFATFHMGLAGGIMVTASHNPMDYNGIKFVREESKPISADTGLKDIEAEVLRGGFKAAAMPGQVQEVDLREEYLAHLLSFVDTSALKPLKLVLNPGNGCAGPALDALLPSLPFEVVKVLWEPDGNFPNGVPTPLRPDSRDITADAVKEHGADLGVAWDGDFDRCFLFDENGGFVEGYYIVGLLASQTLQRFPGSKIIHDPRLTWNTQEMVAAAGGVAVQTKSGHAFIKERMRQEDAIYGGEMSAHHYFKDFSYCDSGMVPWLQVAEAVSQTGKSLSELVGERIKRYPASGEINRKVPDPVAALALAEERYKEGSLNVEHVDGVSIEFEQWRFNLRMSNTEPVVRLNVESRADEALMHEKTEELLEMLASLGGVK
jgi:phosphomannomutase